MCEIENQENKALDFIGELFKVLTATSGIILALLWGLIRDQQASETILYIRIGSIALAICMIASIMGLQFIVSALQRNAKIVSKDGRVALCYFLAWISFILGNALLVVAIFTVVINCN